MASSPFLFDFPAKSRMLSETDWFPFATAEKVLQISHFLLWQTQVELVKELILINIHEQIILSSAARMKKYKHNFYMWIAPCFGRP
jgi:hypothetical protein